MSFFKQDGGPFLIAGPCSAESRKQVFEVAEALKGNPVNLFRAGVWKPRTRPGSFEGMGEDALAWLSDLRKEYGLKTTVEVASPTHVELALKYGMDTIWVGARTTVNPFQVQRIADALKGVDIPVMIKNPVNPDVDLWQGAIERMNAVGVKEVAAIHRGFSSYQKTSVYRNQPNWPLPIELKRRMPELPIICDPSHITGNREIIAEVAQKAMDLGFDGLMIETHTDPDTALSDAAQQVTPTTLTDILSKLVVRGNAAQETNGAALEYLRQEMDSIDAEIVDLLARRIELSKEIGKVKKECDMTAFQPERWRDIVNTRGERAANAGISKEFIIEIYEKIHHHSINKQLEILQAVIKEVKS